MSDWNIFIWGARIVAVGFVLFLLWIMLGLMDKALLGEAHAFERCSWKTIYDERTGQTRNVLVCCDTETGKCRQSG